MSLLILPNLSHIGPEKYFPIIAAEWTPLAIAQNAIETTANAEFEPQWVKQRMPYTDEKVRTVSNSATVTALQRSPVLWTMQSIAPDETTLEAALLYFPGWTVSVDDINTPIEIAEDTGRIRFHIPSGIHQVSIEFKRTPIRWIAEVISLLALLTAISLYR